MTSSMLMEPPHAQARLRAKAKPVEAVAGAADVALAPVPDAGELRPRHLRLSNYKLACGRTRTVGMASTNDVLVVTCPECLATAKASEPVRGQLNAEAKIDATLLLAIFREAGVSLPAGTRPYVQTEDGQLIAITDRTPLVLKLALQLGKRDAG